VDTAARRITTREVSTDIHVAIEKVDIHHGPDVAAALAVITETLERIESQASTHMSTTLEALNEGKAALVAAGESLGNIAADIGRLKDQIAALPTDTADVEAAASAIRDAAVAMAEAAASVAAEVPEDAPEEPPVEPPADETPAEPVEEVPADPPADEPAEAPAE
jgi:hypothetical protein